MSDRDELADVVFSVNGDHDALDAQAIADAVVMAGWRKRPSWDALYGIIVSVAANGGSVANIADAILALMDGGSDER